MKTVDQLTPEMQIGYNAINDLVVALASNIETAKASLERFPQGHNLQVVVINIVWTLGVDTDGRTMKMYSRLEPQGYDIDMARDIKRSWKGKDGHGVPIPTSQLTIVNGRRFLKEQIAEMQERHTEYSSKLTEILA